MHRTMTVKGFIVILCLILAVFLTLHLLMRGDLSRKAEQQEALSLALALLLCGCSMGVSVEELFTLPQLPEDVQ